MKEIFVRRLSFGSYIKLFFLSGLAVGVFMGIIILVIGLLGGPVTANIGSNTYSGMAAGVMAAIMAPLLHGVVFAWLAFLMFLPFKLALKIFKNLKFTALTEDACQRQESLHYTPSIGASTNPIIVQPGIYRHFKGGKYRVLCMALHSETMEPMVVYHALYGEQGTWVRPAGMWKEQVWHEGQTVARFAYIGQDEASVQ